MPKEPSYKDLLERMHSITEHSNELFYLHDTNHILSYVSPTSEKILGYTPEELMINWTELTTDNQINQEGFEHTERAIRNGQRQNPYLLELIKKDGTHAMMEVDESPIKDDNGRVVAIVGALRDVTQRIRSEKALQESEDRFKDMAELLPEIIYEIDTKGNLTFVNQPAYSQFQYTKEEFDRGLNALDMIVPEDRERGMSNIMKILSGEHVGLKEYRALRKDGSTFPALFHSAAIVRNGENVGLRGVIIDITERKKMEEALKESEANYRQLFHHAPAGIYEFDIGKRRFISVNEVMCEYTGYTEEEFLKLDAMELLSDDSLDSLASLLEKAASGDSNPDPVEYQIKGKNNREFWVLVHSRFSYDAEGNPCKVTGVAHDITERRQAEEDKKRLEKKLMQVQKMEALGTLSGGIAHDFNNLMTGILGNTSLILFDMEDTHENHERLKQIEFLVKKGANLTRQLLGLSRQGKFESVPSNLNTLIRESVDIYGRTKKDIQIHLKLQKEIWTVVIDRSQIEQALLNIYINAWQAMPQGGNLYVSTQNCVLGESETMAHEIPAGPYVKIEITDTGVGMDKKTIQRVFDPFFTTKETERGTGLGLASAYGIIENHDGIINVTSEPGIGSTFFIYLPASDIQSEKPKQETGEIIPGRGSLLVIDDEVVVAETAKNMLEKLGYGVTLATEAEEALSLFRAQSETYDLVILDLIMPTMGGYEIYEHLKQIKPKVKVLISSGYSINDQVIKMISRGCKGFIQKPFTVSVLSHKVSQILAYSSENKK